MGFLFANNAKTTLASSVSSGATSVTLATGSGAKFPTPGSGNVFVLTIVDAATGNNTEIMYCTARTGDVCTVERAQEGTVAQNWAAGDFANNLMSRDTAASFAQTGDLGSMATQNANAVAITGGSIDVPTLKEGGLSVVTNPMTTLGDIIVGGASGAPARLGVGSDGQVITADHTQPDGLKWATPPSGGGGSYTFGTYSARPSASTLGAGNIYSATDTQENYYSNGTSYTVLPGGGTEIGYAEIATSQNTSSGTASDVTGLTFTFVAPEKPIMFIVDGVALANNANVLGNFSMQIDGTEVCSVAFSSATTGATGGWNSPIHREVRLSALTPGTTYTAKLQFVSVSGAGQLTAYATTTDAFFIRATTT